MISINATLVLQVIHLLILIFILNRLLFRPTLKMISERTAFIENSRNEIMEIEKETERLRNEYLSRHKRAMREAGAKGTQIKEQGLQEVGKIMERSIKEIETIRMGAEKKANTEVESARPQLHGQAATLADDIAERVIGRKIRA